MPRSRVVVVATGSAVGYLALTAAVAAGLTLEVDDSVYAVFRPEGVWGPVQVQLADVVHALRPVVCVVVLALTATSAAVVRRSWAPVTSATLLTVPTSAVVWATKWVIERADPAGGLVPHAGAYPSGHAALALTSAAGVALVLHRPVPRWARVVVVAFWAFVSLALLTVGLHWVSDVLGGSLLALAVLASTLLVLGEPSSERITPKAWRLDAQSLHNRWS